MGDLIVPELHFELAILPERSQVTLIVVEAALGLVPHVVAAAEQIFENNVRTANQDVITNVAIFVQFRRRQLRCERQIGPAIDVAPESTKAEFNRASRFGGLG